MAETQEQLNERIVEELFNAVNWMGNDDDLAKAIVDRLVREHRTLQQNLMRVLFMVVRDYAAKNTGSDLRNEGAVKWAKAVAAIDAYMPFI